MAGAKAVNAQAEVIMAAKGELALLQLASADGADVGEGAAAANNSAGFPGGLTEENLTRLPLFIQPPFFWW